MSNSPKYQQGSYVQLILRLPDVVEAEDVGMVDKLHDDDLAFDSKEDLVFLLADVGHGHPRRHQSML